MNEIITLNGSRAPKQLTKAERAKNTLSTLSTAIREESARSFVNGGLRFADSLIAALQATDESYTNDEMIEFINTIKSNLAEESVH